MTERTRERTRPGRSFAQEASGFLFCLVGGFFAVSIVQFLRGHEPKESVSTLAWPVVELVALLGAPAALLFSLALAVLGTVLFLRSSPLAPLRPFLALVFGALGVALLAGAFGAGGELGGWLPGLVSGFLGRAITVLLGAALAWLGWSLLFAQQAARPSSPELVQRLGLSMRPEGASGVTPAEAALLVTEPKSARPAPRREEPVRIETIRPHPPAPAEPLRPRADAAPARTASEAVPATPAEPAVTPVRLPAPSWEAELAEAETEEEEEEEEQEEQAEEAEELETGPWSREEDAAGAERAAGTGAPVEREPESEPVLASVTEAFDGEVEAEEAEEQAGEEELAGELAGEEEHAAESPASPTASWEQIGLFDEEEPVEAAPEKAAKPDLTPSFDFESSEPVRHVHEPEESAAPAPASPSAASPSPASPSPVAAELPRAEPERPAPREDFTLQPHPPAEKPVPVVARDEDQERWSQLVYEAGCLILEQQRVAVSMLERRFGIDFDRACRVLDELQQAGLIGPYIGGRTRDILLTREEWLPHAPHAS